MRNNTLIKPHGCRALTAQILQAPQSSRDMTLQLFNLGCLSGGAIKRALGDAVLIHPPDPNACESAPPGMTGESGTKHPSSEPPPSARLPQAL